VEAGPEVSSSFAREYSIIFAGGKVRQKIRKNEYRIESGDYFLKIFIYLNQLKWG